MSESPFIPFYTSDFLGGTSGMTASTKGVYITLLCLMYETEAPLHQQWDALARRCGCTLPAFRKAVDALVDDGKVEVIDGRIWSSKCEKHITQRRERSDSAKAAAEKRWEKTKGKQHKADATALRTQCKPEPEPEPKSSSYEEQAREAFALFSAMAERIGCAVPAKFSDARKRSLLARLSECGGMDGWKVALGKVEASSFLRGSAWLGIDWMLKPSNFTKIMEGNYDDRDCTSARGSNTGRSGPHDALMAGFARLANSDDGTGGDDFSGGEASYRSGPQEMDGWPGGDASQPLLRLVGER